MLQRQMGDTSLRCPCGRSQSGRADGDGDDGRDIDDPATTFGELLSCLRLATRVSQSALGREAAVDASYINRLERGERATPTREVVIALARALQATPTERDRLLWTAGYLPVSLQALGPEETALAAVLQVLTNDAVAEPARQRFRACIVAIATHWSDACPLSTRGQW